MKGEIEQDLIKQLKSAYRKFKTYTYYDNYGAINRAKLADFEVAESISKDTFFEGLAADLCNKDERKKLFESFSVDILCYPKPRKSNKGSLGNIPHDDDKIKKLNYFIDLDIKAHILGTLWILRCGWILDHRLNKNIHGNRINKEVLSKIEYYEKKGYKYSEVTPFLFEPYFKRYQFWRDEGLDSVEKLLDKKENAIMLSLDFKEYYYTSTIDFKKLKLDIEKAKRKLLEDSFDNLDDINKELDEELTDFVARIFEEYTKYFERYDYSEDNELPMISLDFLRSLITEDFGDKINSNLDKSTDFIKKIFKECNYAELNNKLPLIPLGFLPSLIISNWNLQAFDQTVLDLVNPNYYGRYVDDVLIVFKSQEESKSFLNEEYENLTPEEIIKKYLTTNLPEPNHNILKCIDKKKNEYGVNNLPEKESIYKGKEYTGNESNYKNLRIQSDKLKVFMFNHNYPRALIENFKKEIYRNSSEFRLMHEVERSYSSIVENIFSIQYAESINKIGDIENIKLNKFELSKALSWLIRSSIYEINGTDGLSKENRKNIVHAFSGSKKIDFMILWEKFIEFLFIQKEYKTLGKEIEKIFDKISKLEVKTNNGSTYKYKKNQEYLLKKSLRKFLYLTYVRVSSLKKVKETSSLEEKEKILQKKVNDKYLGNLRNIDNLFLKLLPKSLKLVESIDDIDELRGNFVSSYLYKTSLMKDPLFLIEEIPDGNYDLINYDFSIFKGKNNEDNDGNSYEYYPRYVQFHEATIHRINMKLFQDNMDQLDINEYLSKSNELYNSINGFGENNKDEKEENPDIESSFEEEENLFYKNVCSAAYKCDGKNDVCKFIQSYDDDSLKVHIIKTGLEKKLKVKVGLINTKLENKLLEKALIGNPNRTSNRLDKIAAIINEAVKKKVELLVMPEMYIPYKWIPGILDISRTHNMAMVFGIEPIIYGRHVGNYIGMALPSETENKQNCTLIMRLKNSYSPEELREYRKHNLKPKKNGLNEELPHEYVLCIWNDIYFAPYYCYEIANIDHRSLFKSCCDMVIVSEYNKDTAYFTAIAESLSRDLFCYCVKVNSSEFGGTCILQPSKRENKYLIKLKGGIEDYVVAYDLDINKLRNHQILNYESPIKDTDLKPKPPGFDIDKVRRRMKLPPRCNMEKKK